MSGQPALRDLEAALDERIVSVSGKVVQLERMVQLLRLACEQRRELQVAQAELTSAIATEKDASLLWSRQQQRIMASRQRESLGDALKKSSSAVGVDLEEVDEEVDEELEKEKEELEKGIVSDARLEKILNLARMTRQESVLADTGKTAQQRLLKIQQGKNSGANLGLGIPSSTTSQKLSTQVTPKKPSLPVQKVSMPKEKLVPMENLTGKSPSNSSAVRRKTAPLAPPPISSPQDPPVLVAARNALERAQRRHDHADTRVLRCVQQQLYLLNRHRHLAMLRVVHTHTKLLQEQKTLLSRAGTPLCALHESRSPLTPPSNLYRTLRTALTGSWAWNEEEFLNFSMPQRGALVRLAVTECQRLQHDLSQPSMTVQIAHLGRSLPQQHIASALSLWFYAHSWLDFVHCFLQTLTTPRSTKSSKTSQSVPWHQLSMLIRRPYYVPLPENPQAISLEHLDQAGNTPWYNLARSSLVDYHDRLLRTIIFSIEKILCRSLLPVVANHLRHAEANSVKLAAERRGSSVVQSTTQSELTMWIHAWKMYRYVVTIANGGTTEFDCQFVLANPNQ